MPAELATTTALRDVARVLAPGGVWLANLPDEPGLRFVARVCASAAAAGLGHQVLVATHEVLKGRRFGNVVLVAGADPQPEEHDPPPGRAVAVPDGRALGRGGGALAADRARADRRGAGGVAAGAGSGPVAGALSGRSAGRT